MLAFASSQRVVELRGGHGLFVVGAGVKARVANYIALGGLLLAATLIVRGGDGSLVWGAAADALARAQDWVRPLCAALLGLVIIVRYAPRAAVHMLRIIFVAALGLGIWWNCDLFDSMDALDVYQLSERDRHTLLSHAETSPSDYERTHLALYLALQPVVAGKTVIVDSPETMNSFALTRISRAREMRTENYNAALSAEELSALARRPHTCRRDVSGREFLIFTGTGEPGPDAYRLLRRDDRCYLVPASWIIR